MGKDWKKKDDKGDGDKDPKLSAKVLRQRSGSHDNLPKD